MATGFGLDVHTFGGDPPLLLCGVVVDPKRGLAGTSDADVGAHAVADALLGAAALGDIGTHFPSSSGEHTGADSMELLARVVEMLEARSLTVTHIDLTIVAQSVRVAPHRGEMRQNLSRVLRLDPGAVSVKATTTDGLGMIGRDEGIAAIAVADLDTRS